jgi:hypothetical protein
MGTRFTQYLRRHVVACLALVFALSGTAYALGRNSVDSRELAPNSVKSSELANNAVTSSNVQNGSLGAAEFDDGYCGYVGQILLVGFDFAPNGSGSGTPDTLPADGRLLPIQGYEALYSLYGNTYGGNGNPPDSNFALPKLNGPGNGTQYIVCINGVFPPRS